MRLSFNPDIYKTGVDNREMLYLSPAIDKLCLYEKNPLGTFSARENTKINKSILFFHNYLLSEKVLLQ